MRPGSVPTSRIGPIIEELVRDRWPHGGGYGILAEKVGCDESAIEGIAEQTWEGMSFDLADKLLCGLGRVDLWQGALADVYSSVDLSWKECDLPSCRRWHPALAGNHLPQRYCSQACNKLASKVRNGEGTGKRYVARNRCLKGHKLSSGNVVLNRLSDGTTRRQCKQCKRVTALKASRKYQTRKKAERLLVAA